MIGQTISHFEILDKLGEVRPVPQTGTDETSSQLIDEAMQPC